MLGTKCGDSLQQSWVHSLDPRLRVMAATLFSLITVLSPAITALSAALLFSFVLTLQARLAVKQVFRRLLAMEFGMLFLLVSLPFTTPGEPIVSVFGFSASREGLMLSCHIAIKANAVALVMLSLLSSLSPNQLGHALAELRVPAKLVHLMLFMVRYLDVIHLEYKRMRCAMESRAFSPGFNLHTCRSVGYLVGMLLIRSLERVERIMAAMKCRGFNGQLYLIHHFQWQYKDSLFCLMWSLVLLTITGLNFL